MVSSSARRVTELLVALDGGERSAWDELLPIVDAEFRHIARVRLGRGPRRGLNVTELVNETYVRLLQRSGGNWQSRRHFYGVVARAMQGLLLDHARRMTRLKRGGRQRPVTLPEDLVAETRPADDVLAMHEALSRLEVVDPVQHEIVLLRYFSGLGIDETAQALAVSPSTVDRQWRFARAWLRRELDAVVAAEVAP
jgi:RNA polymerase sigma factor (TIGR02999 family)